MEEIIDDAEGSNHETLSSKRQRQVTVRYSSEHTSMTSVGLSEGSSIAHHSWNRHEDSVSEDDVCKRQRTGRITLSRANPQSQSAAIGGSVSVKPEVGYKGGEEDSQVITNSAPIGRRSIESNTRNPDVQRVYPITAAQDKRVTIIEELDNDSSHIEDNDEGKFHEWNGDFTDDDASCLASDVEAEYGSLEGLRDVTVDFGTDDVFDPNHHCSILDKLLQDLAQKPKFLGSSDGNRRYYTYIENSGGLEVVKARIMECLDQELLGLFEMGRLSVDDLKKISRAKAPRTNRPGIYVHVIYDTTNLDSIGVYVGSTYWLLHPMKEHKNDLLVARSGSQRRRTKKCESIKRLSKHVEFWSGSEMQDFWLCFAELKVHVPRAQAGERGFGPFLNILEKYTALLFRTLPRKWLEAGLPRGSEKKLYAWIGLNNDDPLLSTGWECFRVGKAAQSLKRASLECFHTGHTGERAAFSATLIPAKAIKRKWS
jgi:hypothetical protein